MFINRAEIQTTTRRAIGVQEEVEVEEEGVLTSLRGATRTHTCHTRRTVLRDRCDTCLTTLVSIDSIRCQTFTNHCSHTKAIRRLQIH
jgi:hypothetical protein